MLPETESVVTRFRLLKSAMICNTVRTGISWKFNEMGLPLVLLRRRGGNPFFHLDDEHLVGLIVTVVKLAVHRELEQGVIVLAEHLHLGDRVAKSCTLMRLS